MFEQDEPSSPETLEAASEVLSFSVLHMQMLGIPETCFVEHEGC